MKDKDLLSSNWTNSGKMLDPAVFATVNGNKQIFVLNNELINDNSLAEMLTQDKEKQFYNWEQEKSLELNEQQNNKNGSSPIG